jgi:superfamily II DNA/RNA helicase
MTYTRAINKSSFRQRQYGNSKTSPQRFQRRGNPRRREYINPALYIKKALEPKEDTYIATHAFSDFSFSEQLKANIKARGYETPTPIQDQAIEHILLGRDVVGMANTGTGKTAAFLLPLIDKVFRDRSQRVLIIAPTRELAVQIEDEFRRFSRGLQLYSALCIGGAGIFGQIRLLRRNPHFVIGTPGRLKDLEQQRVLNFATFSTIVLDEVDRMLDMGFINDVKYIVSKLSTPRHSLFFSATLPRDVSDVMQHFLSEPITVSVKSGESALYVDQDIVRLNGKQKIDVLHDLLIQETFEKVLVFGRTKWGMEKLAREMEKRGFKVASIHGNKSQGQRQRAIEQFKSNRIQVLLATDIASRGLDIDNVTHVINYDIPESYEDYVHRIGRTGRAGKKGVALTFLD